MCYNKTMKKLKEYYNFRKNFNFKMKALVAKEEGIFCDNFLVENEKEKVSETESFLNIGYNFKNSLSRVLSNLYPLEFKFRNKKVSSIEGVLQGIKYKDKKLQNLVLKYSGLDAYHTRGVNIKDFWGNTQTLYWQGKEIKRDSEEYQLFLDELYLSAAKNQIYKRALLTTENKYLLHHIGRESILETVLTRYEFEERLNSLREFIKITNK